MATAPHVLVVEARYYEAISEELLRGTVAALKAAGATYEVVTVPGAFEIPGAISIAHAGEGPRRIDGYVALGCVIRGETTHYDYVCNESARGLQVLAVQHGLPIGFGILTVENEEQAWERAKVDKGNKGADAVKACLAMIALREKFGLGRP